MLIEAEGWRPLTDPTFDPPGRRCSFAWGASSRKLAGQAMPASEVGPIDALVLTTTTTFGITGPLRYTLTAREGAELGRLIRPRRVIPVHCEGWSHFRRSGPPGKLSNRAKGR